MSKHIVIVESPAKSKTIEKYLGKGYTVLASYGHVRDLVPKEGAVDTDNDFAMKYQLIERNEKHVEKIAKAVKKADSLYLATDPDREGEAISWHVYEVLRDRGLLDEKHVARVVFNEITKRAIQDAIANPRELSETTRQRATGTPRARLLGWLQLIPATVEEGTAGVIRRAGAKSSAPPDRRARAGN